VWSDQGNDDWISISTGLTTRSYTATNLYSGTTYLFKAKSRNSVGYSELSEPVEIVAAQKPD
jgi:hypothetical protein